jgi:hypothetical protein
LFPPNATLRRRVCSDVHSRVPMYITLYELHFAVQNLKKSQRSEAGPQRGCKEEMPSPLRSNE